MRLCVIGNSHAGSLKRGWDEIKSLYPDIGITFFAQHGKGLGQLAVRDGELVPRTAELKKALSFTSGGCETINPDCYDVFLIYGLQCRPYLRKPFFYSRQVEEIAITDMVTNTISFAILSMIRCLTDKPVYIGHNPLLAALNGPAKTGAITAYTEGLLLMNELIYEPMSAKIVPQPEESITAELKTKVHFSKGSRRLAAGGDHDAAGYPDHDRRHMNDEFGAIYVRQFLATLGS